MKDEFDFKFKWWQVILIPILIPIDWLITKIKNKGKK